MALSVLAFACATGGQGSGDDAGTDTNVRMDAGVTVKMDSNTSTLTDAPKMDAIISLPDAFVPPPQDAPTGPFCMGNSSCTMAGHCCFVAVCVPGTGIGNDLCFPD
jgi:hypothetical protein